MQYGAFEDSSLEDVQLPATLKRIECNAFVRCRNLKRILLPEGLEYIGKQCFSASGLEGVVLPSSVKAVGGAAFYACEQLRYAQLNESLELLGGKWDNGGESLEASVFCRSGIEGVRVPSTLKTIEAGTFADCQNLKSVEFAEGLEKIGPRAFAKSGIESVALPQSIRIVCGYAFYECRQLRSAWLNEGLEELGTKEHWYSDTFVGGVFSGSAPESVGIPPKLTVVGPNNFNCFGLNKIEFLEGERYSERTGKTPTPGTGSSATAASRRWRSPARCARCRQTYSTAAAAQNRVGRAGLSAQGREVRGPLRVGAAEVSWKCVSVWSCPAFRASGRNCPSGVHRIPKVGTLCLGHR